MEVHKITQVNRIYNFLNKVLIKLITRKLDTDSAKVLAEICINPKKKIFLCIGAPEHVWDSYGPMVGSFLQEKNIVCFGTMNSRVDSYNVELTEEKIRDEYKDALIIAVDSAVTKNEDKVGKISILRDGLKPGEAFTKNLRKVGDYSILFGVDLADVNNKLIALPFNAALETYNVIKAAMFNNEGD